MKIVSFKICPFVQRVTALLEAKDIPYDLEFISLSNKPQWFLDISPNGQVPVLMTGDGKALFESETKYDSGTGWPSFSAPVPGGVIERLDPGDLADARRALMMGGIRTEVIDAASGAHLGHVFNDGPREHGGERYCINSVCLTFEEDEA